MGRREEGDEGGVKWRDGAKGGVAVGRRSRLSFQCEEGEGELRRTLSDVQTTESSLTHTHTHTQHTSQCLHVQCSKLEGPGRQTCA